MTSEMENSEYQLLIVRYLSEETSAEENKQLLAWLKLSPDNVLLLNQMREISLASRHNKIFNTQNAIDNFDFHITHSEKPVRKSQNIRKLIVWTSSIAAACALLFGVYYYTYKAITKTEVLAQTIHQKTEMHLVDGTIVTLNKNTMLFSESHFYKNNRTLSLKGEAFFKVYHDQNHPFCVHVNDVTITVKGTEFNVFADSITKKLIVSVKEGIVVVKHNANEVILTAGEQVTVENGHDVLVKESLADANYESWVTGRLEFNDTPLKEVVAELSKYYGVQILIESKELESCKLNASFNNTSIENVIEVLKLVLKANVVKESDNQIIISQNETK